MRKLSHREVEVVNVGAEARKQTDNSKVHVLTTVLYYQWLAESKMRPPPPPIPVPVELGLLIFISGSSPPLA